jgi:hypothetical protein
MKKQLIKTLSLATFALSLSSFTGCIIVLDGNGGDDGWPKPEPQCPAMAIYCEPGTQSTRVDFTDDDCPISKCVAIACETHSDCDGPDLACLPAGDCTALAAEGGDSHCEKTCQITAQPPEDLCEDVDCGEGYMCVIEDPCNEEDSPTTGDCDERAACVPGPEPIEENPEESEPQETDREEEEDTEEMTMCNGDWDCEDSERCVFPAEDGLEEETNCGSYITGICVPSLF